MRGFKFPLPLYLNIVQINQAQGPYAVRKQMTVKIQIFWHIMACRLTSRFRRLRIYTFFRTEDLIGKEQTGLYQNILM